MQKAKNILGIEIGGTKIQLLLRRPVGKDLLRERFSVDIKSGSRGILEQIKKGIHTISQKEKIDAVGIGFGGPIDYDSGIISQSSHVSGWNGFHLVKQVKDITHCPVFAENDANVAALGEARQGAGRGYESVFYITIGSGVGGGYIRNGSIVNGRKPGESEIGLLNIDFHGNRLQDLASGWGVDAQIRKQMDKYPDSHLTRLSKEDPGNEARHLGPSLLMGDDFAQNIFRDSARYLALAFSHVIHLIHPDVLIIGGGFSQLGMPLCNAIEDNLLKLVTQAFRPLPPLLLCSLGEDAVTVGAIEFAKTKVALMNNKQEII